MKYIIFAILLLSPVILSQNPNFIVEVFRHGARAPQNTTYDPNNWNPSDAGQLTPSGMRMHYILGESLAANYSELLFPYSPASIYVRSTNFNRTIMSAYSQLYGIYQNVGQEYNTSISTSFNIPPYDSNWINTVYDDIEPTSGYLPFRIQAVPVHEVESSDETLLFNGPQTCPASQSWENSRMNDTYSYQIWEMLVSKNYVDFYIKNGCPVNSLMDVWLLGDTLVSDYYSNVSPLPCNISYNDEIYNATVFAFEWFTDYVFVGTNQQLSLFSTDLLWQLYNWFQSYTNGTNTRNAVLLSAHDTTLLTILGSFNLTYPECLYQNYLNSTNNPSVYYENCYYPSFASHIVFEFYNVSEPYILFYFNDLPLPICGSETSNNCTLSEFYQYITNVTMGYNMNDFNTICGLLPAQNTENNYLNICIILGSILILEFIGVIAIFIMRKRQNQSIFTKIENSSAYMKV